MQLGEDNIFGAIAKPPDGECPDETLCILDLVLDPVVDRGYYLFVRPLPVGDHTIAWDASWECDLGAGPQLVEQRITYDLTVGKK